jgi:hypothetical protein
MTNTPGNKQQHGTRYTYGEIEQLWKRYIECRIQVRQFGECVHAMAVERHRILIGVGAAQRRQLSAVLRRR